MTTTCKGYMRVSSLSQSSKSTSYLAAIETANKKTASFWRSHTMANLTELCSNLNKTVE